MIDEQEIRKLAQLVRIKLSDEETAAFRNEFETVLAYITQIQETTVKEKDLGAPEHRNVMREDREPHAPGTFTAKLLAESGSLEGSYVKVKKILSQD